MTQFERNDFPENPDWGIEKKFLFIDTVSDPRNTANVNFARALAEAKQAGLADDICLAVAACVREGGYGFESGRNFQISALAITITPIEGIPEGIALKPVIKVDVNYYDGNQRSFVTEDIMRYHIPTMTGRELTTDSAAQLPETLWNMSTHPEAGKPRINMGHIQVSEGLGSRHASGYRPTGLISLFVDQDGKKPLLLAKFPIDRLNLTDNEDTLLREAGDDGFAMVMKERQFGNKIDGKKPDELNTALQAYQKEVTTARAQEDAAELRESAKPQEGLLKRLTGAFRRGK